jgi:tetratricopeptide (TPR) repeat protein
MAQAQSLKSYILFGQNAIADAEYELAVEQLDDALTLFPDSPALYRVYSAALIGQGKAAKALASLQRATSEAPHESSLFTILGNIYIAQFMDYSLAEEQFARGIAINPTDTESYEGYVACRIQHSHFDELWPDLSKQAQPERLLEALIVQLRYYGRYEEVLSAADRMIRDFGRRPAALLALARVEEERQHDLIAARRHLGIALHLYPALIPAHLGYVSLMVKDGKWPDAGRHLRWVLKQFGHSFPEFQSDARNWDGSDLQNKTILLDSPLAFGYGDFVNFSRFATVLHNRGARVRIRTRKPLTSLLATVPGVEYVAGYSDPLPRADYIADMSIVWLCLGTTMENASNGNPYLSAPCFQLDRWRLSDRKATLRVGLIPKSADRYTANPYTARNVRIEEFSALDGIESVKFYSFEMPASIDWKNILHDVETISVDFPETATALSQMDLVISVDTAMAHIAGALNRPGLLLLPHSPDWRWMLNRKDTPWYPSLQVIRQPTPGDWRSVMKRCASIVKNLSSQKRTRMGIVTPS